MASWPSEDGYDGGMATSLELTAVFETVDDDWVQARIEELPAVITAAPTLNEAKEMLLDALREYLLSLATESVAPEGAGGRLPLEIVIGAA